MYWYHCEMNISGQDKHLAASGRSLQKFRTRRALIDAAGQLIREGKSPTVPEVAEAALVSTPTAYRYFSSPQELRMEVSIHAGEPDPDRVFADAGNTDVVGRVTAMVRAIGRHQLSDEATWRNVARVALERWFAQAQLPDGERLPVRGDRRLQWISQALEPVAEGLDLATRKRLSDALALTFGTEALVTVRDVCGLETDEALDVMAWAAAAMIEKAFGDGASS